MDERLVILYPSKSSLDFNLIMKPDLVWIATEFLQYKYILSLASLINNDTLTLDNIVFFKKNENGEK